MSIRELIREMQSLIACTKPGVDVGFGATLNTTHRLGAIGDEDRVHRPAVGRPRMRRSRRCIIGLSKETRCEQVHVLLAVARGVGGVGGHDGIIGGDRRIIVNRREHRDEIRHVVMVGARVQGARNVGYLFIYISNVTAVRDVWGATHRIDTSCGR
jgi:hypothetical protein